MRKGATGRAAALAALRSVIVEHRALDRALKLATEGQSGAGLEPREIALANELAYGTMRYLCQLDALANQLLKRPLRARDALVRIALLLGLYQLIHTRIPAHAAISESVGLLASEKVRWGRAVVNGCLRAFERRRSTLLAELASDPQAHYSHPSWIIETLRNDWPGAWSDILKANNARGPMTLRVNSQNRSRETYLQTLCGAGIEATPTRHSDAGLVLASAQNTERLPDFAQGAVSVQDEASQLAAPLLCLEPGQRVLDACAAPGGKSAHMLECEPGIQLTAVDRDPQRVEILAAGLGRLGLRANCVSADAGQPELWWDGEPFARILLDAPCSATGVIRRHPDIKYLRRADDIGQLRQTQYALLRAAWALLAANGLLLYATCSVFKAENSAQIVRFLAEQPDAELASIDAKWGVDTAAGRQILPGHDGMDGFFYALLKKR